MSMIILRGKDLKIAYEDKTIINKLDIDINKGEVYTIVGPNGCGKSTLLKGISRCKKLVNGHVYLDSKDINKCNSKEISKSIAILPQMRNVPGDIKVKTIVGYGRYPHLGLRNKLEEEDHKIVRWAMEKTGVLDFQDREIGTLSGGEGQRVFIAMALAQKTEILILDEPTTFLDISHQLEVLELVKDLNEELGITIVMVLHDLNLAARYSSRIIVMKQGEVIVEGKPEEVFQESILNSVFGIHAYISHDHIHDCPYFIPIDKKNHTFKHNV
jgi:iron complex transport system ATP-binding protein